MMALPRLKLLTVHSSNALRFDLKPIQLGLGGCPWRVAVASVLLCRTRRVQMEPILERLFRSWPDPGSLARADRLEALIQPCGFQNRRAHQLRRLSELWLTDSWDDLRDLPGVGKYVADAVGLVCFGCTDLECADGALLKHAEVLRG